MKSAITDHLVCPACLPREVRLSLRIAAREGEELLTGSLRCTRCDARYPITWGIASLLPESRIAPSPTPDKYETPELIAAYLWSHYADLLDDPEATSAYTQWAARLAPAAGFFLDAGCGVGRLTFEMSPKSAFAVGLDTSRSFVRAARKLLRDRALLFSLPEEGTLCSPRRIQLPDAWDCSRIEFLIADAQAVPFPSGFFSAVASLNLVDKLPKPLVHLKELDRVAARTDAQFLFSDPFSWSSEIAEPSDWLGGVEAGPFAGRGHDNVALLLQGKDRIFSSPWTLEARGSLWWTIRTHANHFERIRSHFIKASR